MYLIDTDVLSQVVKRAPSPALLSKLATVPPEQQFTSAITRWRDGIRRLPQPTTRTTPAPAKGAALAPCPHLAL